MAIDELGVVMKARELVRTINPKAIPAPLDPYLAHLGAVLKVDMEMEDNEPGWSFESKGKKYICVNGKDKLERQRFTICHELAHIVLGLPSDHQGSGSPWSYEKKSQNEIFCDVFAAELLLPFGLLKPLAEQLTIGLDSIDSLAGKFEASTMATGSRFAAVLRAPVAFVISEKGKVRYASRSALLREAGGWIPPRAPIPDGSLSAKLRAGTQASGSEEIDAEEWFQHWERGGKLLEEARHLERRDQTLTVLWFEDGEVPPPERSTSGTGQSREDAELLPELDGILRFKPRRR